MDKLSYRIESRKPFMEVSQGLEEAAPKGGFRVLAVHNVQQTLGEKGYKIEPLTIYEVCNAAFAYEALKRDIDAALFMPCKIVVRQVPAGTVIALVKPSLIAEMLPRAGLEGLAADVERRLIGIIDEIK
jgi:uncharacterized protein (DUF302 family)